ncbi:bifunctional non-homologous end joining protein LigD [Cupriavidus sp. YR651]|nr:bifunctional non-homologous end joining protein LigD [Cupriavidus sp. YR651]
MPVAWDELAGLTSAAHWTVADVEARRAEVARRDPCAAHDSVHQTLTRTNKLLSGTW